MCTRIIGSRSVYDIYRIFYYCCARWFDFFFESAYKKRTCSLYNIYYVRRAPYRRRPIDWWPGRRRTSIPRLNCPNAQARGPWNSRASVINNNNCFFIYFLRETAGKKTYKKRKFAEDRITIGFFFRGRLYMEK